MSLYSLHHSSIAMGQPGSVGKAAGRVRYVIRAGAATAVVEARTGLSSMKPAAISAFCAERERQAGRNGRVVETIMVALPREADHDQRVELLRALAEHVTKGEAPYIGAIHDAGKDAANPHAHLVAFEQLKARRPGQRGRTGKVIRLSEDGALERLRADWAAIHNRLMAAWGSVASAIDHRSNAARGIPNLPMLHEGPAVRAMAAKGSAPTSTAKQDWRGRVIPWPEIDEGITRPAINDLVRAFNVAQAKQEQPVYGRPDGVLGPASGHDAGFAEAHGDSAGPHGGCASSDRGSIEGVGRVGEPVSGKAAGASEGGPIAAPARAAPAVAGGRPVPGERGRYRPSRLRALTAQIQAATHFMAAQLARIGWRRLGQPLVPRMWGLPLRRPSSRGGAQRER